MSPAADYFMIFRRLMCRSRLHISLICAIYAAAYPRFSLPLFFMLMLLAAFDAMPCLLSCAISAVFAA